ncbi:MAG TPA: hypothetical protein PK511_01485 [Chitinophagales bacterium]|nr:hypothetical protein [Chitinophagales bacterium]HMU68504.1 hypothetical protein [Chitinophagales bacterium]HNA58926.1 hypothetical protein [Chitinophagales bacterium]HNE44762.1 hypothetical protein [Chitinophagales bacterium]HNF68608.1 hypothetical protein [Chitinophagales bacterium]
MKRLMLLSIFSVFSSLFVKAQSGDVNDLPPIDELGTGTFMGRQGGLYPNGSNSMPAAFYADAMAMAQSVQPLDKSGKPDPKGRIGVIALGASTVAMFSKGLEHQIPEAAGVNKELTFVNCGIGGQDLSDIMNPAANYWSVIDQRVREAGMDLNQIQVIWFQEDNLRNRENNFDLRIAQLTKEFTYMVRFCKEHYPNVKLFYVSGRHTTDFMPADAKDKHREPKAYINGWVCKQLIENQINGSEELAFKGANAVSPLILWGPYFWTQGEKPRKDGYTLTRDMISNDGVHPTEKGIEKVSKDLVDFWRTDPVSQQWFLENPGEVTVDTIGDETAADMQTMAFIINSKTILNIPYDKIAATYKLTVLKDSAVVFNNDAAQVGPTLELDIAGAGNYKYLISDGTNNYAGKVVVDDALQVTVVKDTVVSGKGKHPIDPNSPAWVVNGANKMAKLQHVLRPNTNVKVILTDDKGKEVLVVEDFLNKYTDVNEALDRGEYKMTFYNEKGSVISVPEEFNSSIRVKY